MEVKLSKQALKYVNAQDKPTRERFKAAFRGLSKDPPVGDISPIVSCPPFLRLRVGDFRVIFYEDDDMLRVVKVSPRGGSYK